jgi:hypothetical protein
VEYALDRLTSLVVVLPASSGNHPAIAVFQPGAQAGPPQKTSRTRPGGILGLSEELDLEEESPPERKNWWRRLWSD